MEHGTFLLGLRRVLMLGAHRGCRGVEGLQEPAAMLGLGLLEGDGERGLYHVDPVTEPSQVHHERHPVIAY